jgi:hypothetical protein
MTTAPMNLHALDPDTQITLQIDGVSIAPAHSK